MLEHGNGFIFIRVVLVNREAKSLKPKVFSFAYKLGARYLFLTTKKLDEYLHKVSECRKSKPMTVLFCLTYYSNYLTHVSETVGSFVSTCTIFCGDHF